MKITVYNERGEKTGETLIPKEIFDVPMNTDLIYQVAVSQAANRRRNIAHTKDRSEVRGGGRKPWRQKGTGRSRHGSIRSPIWRGGGVTFGPRKNRDFSKKIPKKMNKKALFIILSAKFKNDLLIVVDRLKTEEIKTRTINRILESLPCKKQSRLLALPQKDDKTLLSIRNIPKTKAVEVRNLNVLDLLSFKYLIISKESIKAMKETFFKKQD